MCAVKECVDAQLNVNGCPPHIETTQIGIICNTMASKPGIVFDTNVLVAALRSRRGASFQLLSRLTQRQFDVFITVPLLMEYADVLHRPGLLALPEHAIDAVLDMICATAHQQAVHFLWRPQLRDPKDELVLEAAVNATADFLVTHNLRDFEPGRRFAVQVVTPGQFLNILDGEKP